jgi:hypothetical protein
VPRRIVICGEVADRQEAERLLREHLPECAVASVGRPWELIERALSEPFDVALLLKGPIATHEERVGAIGALRRNGFAGRIVAAGAFLAEKQDALAAGAHYAFDPDQQRLETVVAGALVRPRVAADHPYLRALLVGEWADVEGYSTTLPAAAPDILLAATSWHEDAAFYAALTAYREKHPHTHCILVEDDGSEDARAEALSSGVEHYVVLAEQGVAKLLDLTRAMLHECWLGRVSAA